MPASSIAEGLQSGLQGYIEGQQARQQMGLEKEQTQKAALDNLQLAMPFYQAAAGQPGGLSNPELIRNINKAMGDAGIGVQFDPSKPLPADFSQPDFLYRNPDTYAHTKQLGIDSFTTGVARLMSENMAHPQDPTALFNQIRMMGAANKIDPEVITDVMNANGVMQGLQDNLQRSITTLSSRAGLDQAKTQQILSLLPAQLANYNARTENQLSQVDWRSARLSQLQTKLDSDVSLNDARVQGILAKIQTDRGKLTLAQRQQYINTLQKSADLRKQLGQMYAAEMIQRPATMSPLSPDDWNTGIQQANTYLSQATAMQQAAADLAQDNSTHPAGVPEHMKVTQPQNMAPTHIYFITAGKNKGKYVWNGKIISKKGGAAPAPYTRDATDKYQDTGVTKSP